MADADTDAVDVAVVDDEGVPVAVDDCDAVLDREAAEDAVILEDTPYVREGVVVIADVPVLVALTDAVDVETAVRVGVDAGVTLTEGVLERVPEGDAVVDGVRVDAAVVEGVAWGVLVSAGVPVGDWVDVGVGRTAIAATCAGVSTTSQIPISSSRPKKNDPTLLELCGGGWLGRGEARRGTARGNRVGAQPHNAPRKSVDQTHPTSPGYGCRPTTMPLVAIVLRTVAVLVPTRTPLI